jgi:phosphoribosylglycinamide formyltransferase-1
LTGRIAVLASGGGTNLQALLDAGLPVALVLSDKPGSGALERARAAGVPAEAVLPRDFPDRAAFDAALAERCRGFDLVCLAGFMRLLGPAFVEPFAGRCLNVHPALLPAFPGLNAPAQAIAHGVKVSGCTVHLVDAGCDTGPIVLQEAVPVHEDDTPETLHARIRSAEHRLLPEAARLFLEGRLRVDGRRVRILREVRR